MLQQCDAADMTPDNRRKHAEIPDITTHSRNIGARVTCYVTAGVTNGKCLRNPRMGNINRCVEARGAAGAGRKARGVTLIPEWPLHNRQPWRSKHSDSIPYLAGIRR